MTTPPKKKKPTLRDVAELAKVSVMTVSNVMNGRTSQVSETVRRDVLDAVAKLDYKPHISGRSLRLSRNFSIGLVILHPERRFLNDPFNTEVAAGMSHFLSQNSYSLLIFGAQNLEQLESQTPRISQQDAIAVFGYGDPSTRRKTYLALASLGVPMLLIGDDLVDGLPDAAYVTQDNEGSAFDLAGAVIRSGARKILFIRPVQEWPAMTQREQGIRKAAAADGVRVETIACSETDFDLTAEQISQRLAADPAVDAVMGGNDFFGIAALRAAKTVGRDVPTDLGVTGFNGFYFRDFSEPLLTSVRSRAYDLGSEAASRLLDRIESGRFDLKEQVFPLDMLIGKTVPDPSEPV